MGGRSELDGVLGEGLQDGVESFTKLLEVTDIHVGFGSTSIHELTTCEKYCQEKAGKSHSSWHREHGNDGGRGIWNLLLTFPNFLSDIKISRYLIDLDRA